MSGVISARWLMPRQRGVLMAPSVRPSGEEVGGERLAAGGAVPVVDEPLLAEADGEGLVRQRQEEVVVGDLAGVGPHRRPLRPDEVADVDAVGDGRGGRAERLL